MHSVLRLQRESFQWQSTYYILVQSMAGLEDAVFLITKSVIILKQCISAISYR